MVRDEIAPLDAEYFAQVEIGDRWQHSPRQTEILEGLKAKARDRGLWNLWSAHEGHQLSTVEYAYFAEQMGRAHLAPESFNCNAPDTGNMDGQYGGVPEIRHARDARGVAGPVVGGQNPVGLFDDGAGCGLI